MIRDCFLYIYIFFLILLTCGCRTIRTNTYQVNFFEVPSGLKFILNTSPDAIGVHAVLEQLYQEVFVEHVTKDPTYTPGDLIDNPYVDLLVDDFLRRKDRKSTRLNSSHVLRSRMPSSA